MSRTNGLNIIFALIVILLSTHASVMSQARDFSCSIVSIKVITDPHTVVLGCTTGWPNAAPTVTVYESKEDPKVDPSKWISFHSGAAAALDPKTGLLTLTLASPLQSDHKYIFVLKNPATPANQADLTVTLSTEAKGTLSPSLAALDARRKFVVNSDVAFDTFNQGQLPSGCQINANHAVANCVIKEKRDPQATKSVTQDAEIQVKALAHKGVTDPFALGLASVELQHQSKLKFDKPTVSVPGLRNAFGQPVVVENAIALPAPPKGKDDAAQFYQISHIGAKGSKPSIGLNIKINSFFNFPSSFFVKDFLVQPDIVVDVGTNSLAKTSADMIHLGVTSTDTWLRESDNFFQGFTFGPGVVYETDREFDKSNLLATFESHPILRGFVSSKEMRRYEAAGSACNASMDRNCVTKFLTKNPQTHYKFGYGLEFFFGLEGGGNLKSQIFQSKSKKTQVDIPTYSIFRARPRLHAFIEYDRFTLDLSSAFRLLATPEFVGEALNDNTVRIRRVAGFQPYNEATLSYGLDSGKHSSISITYKRGAQPPIFNHTNTVQSGFTIKY